MRRVICSLFLCLSGMVLQAQSTNLFKVPDTLNKKRFALVCGTQATIWGGSMVALNKAWYANYPRSKFHFYNDSKEWLQVDKIGHGWSAYWGAQFSTALFRWSGVKKKNAALYGAGMGIAYVTVIEILDGFSAEWGFSVGDIAANTGGALLFSAQEYAWGEQRIQYKFSSQFKKYPDAELQQRADHLYGSSIPERILKDYNHQTYWLSVNPSSFMKHTKFPKWLNIAVGYGADGMYGGYSNVGFDKVSNQFFNLNREARIRQCYLSPDIDLSRITIKGKTPAVLKALHFLKLKIPMPTLELNSKGQLKGHLIYF